jgi:hypothetical protein
MNIQEVYQAQDASDMFFNNELVTTAYSQALEADDLEANFVLRLSKSFTQEESEAIAKDFLRRV